MSRRESASADGRVSRNLVWWGLFALLVLVLPMVTFLLRERLPQGDGEGLRADADPVVPGVPYRAETWLELHDIGLAESPREGRLGVAAVETAAFGPTGDVWVVDHGPEGGSIRAFHLDGDGSVVSSFSIDAGVTLFTPGSEGDLWLDVPVGEQGTEVVRRYSDDGTLLGEFPLPPGLFARSLSVTPAGDVWALSEEFLVDPEQEVAYYSATLVPVFIGGEAVPPEEARSRSVEGAFFGADGLLYVVQGSAPIGEWPPLEVRSVAPDGQTVATYDVPAGFRPYAADSAGRVYAERLPPDTNYAPGVASLGDPVFETTELLVIDTVGGTTGLHIARPDFAGGWAPSASVAPDGRLLAASWEAGGTVRLWLLEPEGEAVDPGWEEGLSRADMVLHARRAPTSLDPYAALDVAERDLMRLLWAGLVSHDASLEPFPVLAQEVPSAENGGVSEDGLEIRYRIRDGVAWSDGVPVTPGDVVATWEYLRHDSPVPRAEPFPGFDLIESVAAKGDEVVVRLSRPFAAGPEAFFPFVLPAHALEEGRMLLNDPQWIAPVCNGPYSLARWDEDGWALVANEGWALSGPEAGRVDVRFDADEEEPTPSGLPEVWLWPARATAEGLDRLGMSVEHTPTGRFWGVLFDARSGVTADPAVRRALVLAYPAAELADGYFDEPPASQPWSSAVFGDLEKEVTPRAATPDEAAAVLEQAGWSDSDGDGIREKDGVRLTVYVEQTARDGMDEVASEAVDRIKEAWRAVGVDARHGYTRGRYYDSWLRNGYLSAGPFSAGLGVFPGFPDAAWGGVLDPRDTPGVENPRGLAIGGWQDASLASLFAQAEAEQDAARRTELSAQAFERWREGAWGVVERWEMRPLAVDGVIGVEPGPYPAGDLWNVWKWTLADGGQGSDG